MASIPTLATSTDGIEMYNKHIMRERLYNISKWVMVGSYLFISPSIVLVLVGLTGMSSPSTGLVGISTATYTAFFGWGLRLLLCGIAGMVIGGLVAFYAKPKHNTDQ